MFRRYLKKRVLTGVRTLFFNSRDEKIRTSDLQHPMLARYRATLHPEFFITLFSQNSDSRTRATNILNTLSI